MQALHASCEAEQRRLGLGSLGNMFVQAVLLLIACVMFQPSTCCVQRSGETGQRDNAITVSQLQTGLPFFLAVVGCIWKQLGKCEGLAVQYFHNSKHLGV